MPASIRRRASTAASAGRATKESDAMPSETTRNSSHGLIARSFSTPSDLGRWLRCVMACAAAGALVAFAVASQASELKPWNQAEVTKLAKQLSEAVTSLRAASINDPALNRNGPQDRRAKAMLDGLRNLERSCRQLARKLEQGEDREKTLGVARKTGSLIRDVQVASRGFMTSESQWAAIDPAVDIINRLSPYYTTKQTLISEGTQR
jgi:hypothetical protein